jgi:hypothetical protein
VACILLHPFMKCRRARDDPLMYTACVSNTKAPRKETLLLAVPIGIVALWTMTVWVVTQNGISPVRPIAFSDVLAILGQSLPVLAAVWIGAAGYGFAVRALLMGSRSGRSIEELALGIATLLMVTWGVASAGLLSQDGAVWVFGLGALLNLLKLVPTRDTRRAERYGPVMPWAMLLLAPGMALLIVAACCPPGTLWQVEAFGYDVTSYHLQLPREWMAGGQMAGLEHNVYSFLPSLIESGYMLIGLLSGSVLDAVYTCQLFHVTLAMLAAAAVGKTVAARTTRSTGVGAAALFLAVPWVTITGSMAYNEMGVLAFGAAAIMIAFDQAGTTRRGAVAIGLLVGAATLSKLTAGMMIAVPVGLVLLFRLNQRDDAKATDEWRYGVQCAVIAALAGVLTLSPYLVRNISATGNPVFPFAAEQLGAGHWDEILVERWDTAHGLSPKQEGKLDSLGRQWLLNTGYGAIGGQTTPREMQNVARFDREDGVPALWIMVAAGCLLLLICRETRRIALALMMMLGVQVVFWMFATHMQSRFLLPTILPACIIAGLGYGRFRAMTQSRAPSVAPLVGAAMIASMGLINFTTLTSQTKLIRDPQAPATGDMLQTPLWMAINAPITTHPDALATHPINRLSNDSKTLLIADNMGLLYLRRPIIYATAFDAAPLGEIIRALGIEEATGEVRYAGDDLRRINGTLRQAGITHVWVHWSELARLHNTYGHDRDVTEKALSRLIASGWRSVETVGRTATLYVLPEQIDDNLAEGKEIP